MGIVSIPRQAGLLDPEGLLAALEAEVDSVAAGMTEDYLDITATWDHAVVFERVKETQGELTVIVYTDDEVLGYLNNGTRPHVIEPRPDNPHQKLFFERDYTRKTSPRTIGSFAGGKHGPMVVSEGVFHPGNPAFAFDEAITAFWQPVFQERVQAVLAEWYVLRRRF